MRGSAGWLRLVTLVALLGSTTGTVAASTEAPFAASDVGERGRSDVCLVLASEGLPAGAWGALAAAIADVVGSRPELFPDPTIIATPATGEAADQPASDHSIVILAGHDQVSQGAASPDDCGRHGQQWTARLSRSFLVAGAERMLQQAPTTPGIASSIHLEWYPGESRVRTRLEFAGPLDIPNGRCWIDDRLAVDPGGRQAVSRAEQGLRTSPFAEAACGRFFDHLTRGGAGEQAVTLLPTEIELADGARLRFEVVEVSVEHDAVVMAGSLGS